MFTAGSVLTKEMVALLHAATTPAPAEPEIPAVENHLTEPEPTEAPVGADPAVAPAAAADEPEWATAVAHLLTPPPIADEFTRLKEALL